MVYLSEMVVLLQVAVSLLTATIGTPQQEQALAFANQAVKLAETALVAELAKQENQLGKTSEVVEDTNNEITNNQEVVDNPTDVVETEVVVKETMELEIINPYPRVGLSNNKKYVAYSWDEFRSKNIPDNERSDDFIFPNEDNYLQVGLVIKDDNGEYLRDEVVEVRATDESQNKVMNSTGNVTPIYVGQSKKIVPFYPYRYDFKQVGEHTITFIVGDYSELININVVGE